ATSACGGRAPLRRWKVPPAPPRRPCTLAAGKSATGKIGSFRGPPFEPTGTNHEIARSVRLQLLGSYHAIDSQLSRLGNSAGKTRERDGTRMLFPDLDGDFMPSITGWSGTRTSPTSLS